MRPHNLGKKTAHVASHMRNLYKIYMYIKRNVHVSTV